MFVAFLASGIFTAESNYEAEQLNILIQESIPISREHIFIVIKILSVVLDLVVATHVLHLAQSADP